MSILQEFENMRYRYVLDLIKNEEQYDKKKVVITAEEAFKLFYKRYLLMKEILLPLKKKLGEKVEVTDISFVNGMQDDMSIVIKYTKEEKNYVLALSNLDYEDITIISTDVIVSQEQFVDVNKRIIIDTFRNISNNGLDEENIIKSTTKKFIIKDNCDKFKICDIDEKVFGMEGSYSIYEKNGSIFDLSKITCNYSKLKEMLSNSENGLAIYQHMHIYEEDIPKELIKKIN